MDLVAIVEDFIERSKALSSSQRFAQLQELLSSIPEEHQSEAEDLYFRFRSGDGNEFVGKCVVVLIHGIRDNAVWHDKLDKLLKSRRSIAAVESIDYGFMNLFGFIFHWVRESSRYNEIEIELDEITRVNPDKTITVIAHSYGTYLFSKFIKKRNGDSIDRVIFCGSIVKEKFDWNKYRDRDLIQVLNDCGDDDIWPVIAKIISFRFGAAGKLGFRHKRRAKNRFHACGHDGFFNEEFYLNYWVPYIEEGLIKDSTHERSNVRWWMSAVTSVQCFILWGSLISILLLWSLYSLAMFLF